MAADWGLLSTHGLVLAALALAEEPLTLRQIGDTVGVTERSAFRVITDLQKAGFLQSHKVGRRNFYEILPDAPLRHPLMAHITVGDLLRVVAASRSIPQQA